MTYSVNQGKPTAGEEEGRGRTGVALSGCDYKIPVPFVEARMILTTYFVKRTISYHTAFTVQ